MPVGAVLLGAVEVVHPPDSMRDGGVDEAEQRGVSSVSVRCRTASGPVRPW
jgi:hypothetical protein